MSYLIIEFIRIFNFAIRNKFSELCEMTMKPKKMKHPKNLLCIKALFIIGQREFFSFKSLSFEFCLFLKKD